MKPLISVLIVNFNSADFVGLSLFALQKLTQNKYQVFILDNGSQKSDFFKLQKIVADHPEVSLERSETDLRGSMAHGTALNALVKKVDTPYFCILDADATWLIEDWDEILLERMNDKVKVVGTQADSAKPQDFPLMFAALFETETFQKLHIDFRPKDIAAREDTGFELREKYLQAGYHGENITVRSTRTCHDAPFRDIICSEYYLDDDDHIFASHFGRGSSLGAAKYKKGWRKILYNLPILGPSLLRSYGNQEKWAWIEKCQEIIIEQITADPFTT